MKMVVADASADDCECGSVFGIDAFEGDAVTYSIIPGPVASRRPTNGPCLLSIY